jgi:hypothetical protein
MSSTRSRFAALLAATFAVLASPTLGAQPALAHGGGTPIPDAAFYRTEVTTVTPQPASVTVRADPAGDYLELTNTGATPVIVLGYLAEPYLRVTAGGVEENAISPSAYINKSLFADTMPTGGQAADVAPAWHQIATVGKTQWHDHRIHWMGQTPPPAVGADPAHAHPVGTWVVHATADGKPFDIHGTLRWIGKPGSGLSIQTWQIVAANIAALGAGLIVFRYTSRRKRKQPPTEPAESTWLVSTDTPR